MAKEQKVSVLDQILDQITPAEMNRHRERMRVAAALDDILKEKRISKVELARLMDKEPSIITRWLSGTHNFQLDTLSEICFALGIHLSQLFYEKENPITSSLRMAVIGTSLSYPSTFHIDTGNIGISFIDPAPLFPGFIGLDLGWKRGTHYGGSVQGEYFDGTFEETTHISKSSKDFYVITPDNKLEKHNKTSTIKANKSE